MKHQDVGAVRYTKDELIKQWLDHYPEDLNNADLEEMALGGYIRDKEGLYTRYTYRIMEYRS